MGVISMFYGIIISMYFFDNRQHQRPHIHVKYQEHEAVFSIPEGDVLEGEIPIGAACGVANAALPLSGPCPGWLRLRLRQPGHWTPMSLACMRLRLRKLRATGQRRINKTKLVLAWIEIHRDELMADWELAAEGQTIFKIEPLR